MRTDLLRFDGTLERDPAIDAWLDNHPGPLGGIARRWFTVMRGCGDEVREVLHDGCPTACLGDVPFGYVNVFKAHVNVGFFRGWALPDPAGLLQGDGRWGFNSLQPCCATILKPPKVCSARNSGWNIRLRAWNRGSWR